MRGGRQASLRGKRLGFSLEEIREIIDIYDVDPTERTQLRLLLDKIAERHAALTRQQRDIASMLAELAELEERCSGLLEEKEGSGSEVWVR